MLNARELLVNKCEPIAPRGDGMWQGRRLEGETREEGSGVSGVRGEGRGAGGQLGLMGRWITGRSG